MKRGKPIHQAVSEVLRGHHEALSAEAIFKEIVDRGLYRFKARNPLHVVQSDLKRHCVDLNFPSARRTKYFKMENSGGDNLYRLLDVPVRVEPNVYRVKSLGKRSETIVTVTREDDDSVTNDVGDLCSHTEIQWRLLDLGSKLGLSVWAPMADRGKRWEDNRVGDVPHMIQSLPRQFDPATMRIISYIDVIWLEKQAIMAAFEVEHTSAVYSGLLRMSDLMTMQPNLDIRWYLVAPDQRSDKFATEISRPTFCGLRKPLHKVCRFLPYTKLIQKLKAAQEFVGHLKPGFLDDIAEHYDPVTAFED